MLSHEWWTNNVHPWIFAYSRRTTRVNETQRSKNDFFSKVLTWLLLAVKGEYKFTELSKTKTNVHFQVLADIRGLWIVLSCYGDWCSLRFILQGCNWELTDLKCRKGSCRPSDIWPYRKKVLSSKEVGVLASNPCCVLLCGWHFILWRVFYVVTWSGCHVISFVIRSVLQVSLLSRDPCCHVISEMSHDPQCREIRFSSSSLLFVCRRTRWFVFGFRPVRVSTMTQMAFCALFGLIQRPLSCDGRVHVLRLHLKSLIFIANRLNPTHYQRIEW